ncbi:hypothetical protein [Weissella confusa]
MKMIRRKADVIVAVILSLTLVVLWCNGNKESPREQQYTEAVQNVNKYIAYRVLYAQQWYANDNVKKLSYQDNVDSLNWQVASSPDEAIKWTLKNDVITRENVDKKVAELNVWLKSRHYSKKEISKYKARVYTLSKSEYDQMATSLNKIKSKYLLDAQKKIDSEKTIYYANSSAASESLAAAQSAELAASIARARSIEISQELQSAAERSSENTKQQSSVSTEMPQRSEGADLNNDTTTSVSTSVSASVSSSNEESVSSEDPNDTADSNVSQ